MCYKGLSAVRDAIGGEYAKHDDCASDGIALISYTDEKCEKAVEMTDDQKKASQWITWGECKKSRRQFDGKDVWIVWTGARDLTAAVAVASLAVAATLY